MPYVAVSACTVCQPLSHVQRHQVNYAGLKLLISYDTAVGGSRAPEVAVVGVRRVMGQDSNLAKEGGIYTRGVPNQTNLISRYGRLKLAKK